MYVQRTYHYPLIGKSGELRALLEEHVSRDQVRISLLQQVVLSNGPVLLEISAHESAEAFENWRDTNASDQAVLDFRAKTAPLRSRTVQTRLLKSLVDRDPSVTRGGRYLHVGHIKPLPDKEGEVQSMLIDAVKEYQSERPSIRLLREVFNPEGRVLVIADTYENLTEYDNLLDRRPASIINAMTKANSLSRAPTGHELYEYITRSTAYSGHFRG